MPLPLRLGFIALPVVDGEVPDVDELAAGSPDMEPRPLAAPFWALAAVQDSANAAARINVVCFMAVPFGGSMIIHPT